MLNSDKMDVRKQSENKLGFNSEGKVIKFVPMNRHNDNLYNHSIKQVITSYAPKKEENDKTNNR